MQLFWGKTCTLVCKFVLAGSAAKTHPAVVDIGGSIPLWLYTNLMPVGEWFTGFAGAVKVKITVPGDCGLCVNAPEQLARVAPFTGVAPHAARTTSPPAATPPR